MKIKNFLCIALIGGNMALPKVEHYGSWKSMITAEKIVSDSVKFQFFAIEDNVIYWDEVRYREGGKTFLVEKEGQKEEKDLLDKKYNVRTKANEYGGKSFLVKDGRIFFCNFEDQNIYEIKDHRVEAITNEKQMRYAYFILDSKKDLLFCVEENHQKKKVTHSIVVIDLKSKKKRIIKEGEDFYSSLTISPDGKKLAYLSWDAPNMPWDGTKLTLCNLEKNGNLSNEILIAGGETESIFQPMFSPDNILYFVSDKTGFWNLYFYQDQVEILYPMEAEFGYPQWLFGFSTYSFVKKEKDISIICTYNKNGVHHLAEIDRKEKTLNNLDLPFNYFFNLQSFQSKVVLKAASFVEEGAILLFDAEKRTYEIIKREKEETISEEWISIPEIIEFPTKNEKTAFAFYYPPKNPNFVAPKDTLPPLIVESHGGPTAQFFPIFNAATQYFTSRGFAVLDVNYSGSTGYGRKYRERLYGKWGILDVEDCANAALFLVKKKIVDNKKLVIKGSSAGGYTALAALAFKNIFNAGTSYFGVSDLERLALYTHKFEAHYLEKLIGPYPQRKDLYENRSPIHFVDRITSPLILFQGGEDKIVPKEQAEKMYTALLKKNIPVSYLFFEKEGHGFRESKNIKKALEAELYFYSKIFNFRLSDKMKPVIIENLK